MKNDNRMVIIKSVATLVVHAISCAIIIPNILRDSIESVEHIENTDIDEGAIE